MKISNEYALSLFHLAKEQGRIEQYGVCLNAVREIIAPHPEWLSLLYSPAIPTDERLTIIEAAFGEMEVKEVLYFLKLLCEKGHVLCLEACIAEFFRLENESKKRVAVEVRFASPLTEEQKAKLEEKIKKQTGKIPEIVYLEDPSLIGGIRVQIEDAVFDGSLSGKIRALKGVIKG